MIPMAGYLQSNFTCQKCGKCCSQGGDMSLTIEDVNRIGEYLQLSSAGVLDYFVADESENGMRVFVKDPCPCRFMDMLDKTCTIQDVKPHACMDYPFLLYERGGCTFDAVLVCPEARRLLGDLLHGEL